MLAFHEIVLLLGRSQNQQSTNQARRISDKLSFTDSISLDGEEVACRGLGAGCLGGWAVAAPALSLPAAGFR